MQMIESPVKPELCAITSRKVFAQFATGVCILLAQTEDKDFCRGLTINSFSSLSLEPLLITFSLKSKCIYLKNFDTSARFSINMLSHQQMNLSKECSKAGGKIIAISDLRKKEFYYIPDSLVSMECNVRQMVEAGDHVIFICEVIDMFIHKKNDPLIFFDSKYFTSLS